jgi:hypothetical protein
MVEKRKGELRASGPKSSRGNPLEVGTQHQGRAPDLVRENRRGNA